MLDFVNNLSSRKIALILAVLALFVGSFMVFAFLTVRNSARNSAPTDPGKAIREERSEIPESPELTITPGPVVTTNDFLNDYFAISYPSNWTVDPVVLPNGERNIIFKPSHNTSQKDMFLSILTDNNPSSIEQRATAFTQQGYTQSEEYHNGKKYLKVSNSPDESSSSTQNKSQQISYLYISTQGVVVTVQYVYKGSQKDVIIENFFQQILSTLSIF